ncbi:hypothetical protein GJ496_008031 [Pomphorhynchus laevis]|nr:hypothetical protein GJ496_008031 [Pomphorhynchus laevis]
MIDVVPGDVDQRNKLIEQLTSDSVECLICVCVIRRDCATWNCLLCHNIFHLYCVKKWAQSTLKRSNKRIWNCPTCNRENDKIPNEYLCFCGKLKDPTYHPAILPHSCGEPCLKFRNQFNISCKHPCTELCHPGSCPQCQMIVDVPCRCGKNFKMQQCCSSDIDWFCDAICLKTLKCGIHKCQAKCHSESCEECNHEIQIGCFSHKTNITVSCLEFSSNAKYTLAGYSCNELCNKMLTCGFHKCASLCHSGSCAEHCPMSPSINSTCFCGKKTNEELKVSRLICTDDVPSCGLICGKPLICGDGQHTCQQICHEGKCICTLSTTVSCYCRYNVSITILCNDLKESEKFSCNRTCGLRKTCLRHKCKNMCCQLIEHICDLPCNRRLSCGLHNCTLKCHSDPCPPCKRGLFEDVNCTCGKTVIRAPVPCGTSLPNCSQLCSRVHECDHPVQHNCHQNEQCPPCVFLTNKLCKCGKTTIYNVQCFIQDVSCGELCRKPLPCGLHFCQRICHKGDCVLNEEKCNQLCDRIRAECGHTCAQNCHGIADCPTTVCQSKVIACCGCGRIKQLAICGIESQPEITDAAHDKTDMPVVRFQCDKECVHQSKLARMAAALKINSTPSIQPTANIQYDFTDNIKNIAKEIGVDYVKDIESKLKEFVNETIILKRNQNTFRFKPVGWRKRQLIHELAPYYGCTTVVEGKGNARYVVIDGQFGYCHLPMRTLCDTLWGTETYKIPPPAMYMQNNATASLPATTMTNDDNLNEEVNQKKTFASMFAKTK